MIGRFWFLVTVVTAVVLGAVLPAGAEDVTEHPLIRPFPGSVLDQRLCTHQTFNAFKFPVMNSETGKAEEKTVKGEYRKLVYNLFKEDGQPNKDVSPLEFFENFKAAALAKGGEVKWEHPVRGLVFTLPREDGGVTWCKVEATDYGRNYLNIVDEKPLETKLQFGPAEMKAALDAEGRVVLHNILFAYDKATLQQSSNQQLQNVLTLLLTNPELALEIQGHTDGDGGEDYNLKLSQGRAESVLDYLVLFDIDPTRLRAKGYGESAPVAPNDSDENKAKNRRVELVKIK
jgi:outer membrane protein OmpA-like peptidoglycan-associated protein